MLLIRQMIAEFVGTFFLVFAGIGTAVMAAIFKYHPVHTDFNLGVGHLGVALAVGLAVLTMMYAFGHISGGHFNPAVSLGLAIGGRFSFLRLIPYWIAQVAGAVAGAGALWFVAYGRNAFQLGDFACNGFAEHSPHHYYMEQCFVAEALLTFFFLVVFMGATSKRAPIGFAGLAIGLAFTLIHLVLIPITNGSVNPARSTGTAVVLLFADKDKSLAIDQLWLFWAAPMLGGFVGGFFYRVMDRE
jgi:aquaporin Z